MSASNPYWFASASELRKLESWARNTTITPSQAASILKAPVDRVREIMEAAR